MAVNSVNWRDIRRFERSVRPSMRTRISRRMEQRVVISHLDIGSIVARNLRRRDEFSVTQRGACPFSSLAISWAITSWTVTMTPVRE